MRARTDHVRQGVMRLVTGVRGDDIEARAEAAAS